MIWSRSFSENAAIFDVIRQAAQARGVEVFPKAGGRARPRVCLRLLQRRGRAGSYFHYRQFDVIRQAAQARGVEVFPKDLEGVQEDGGLMSYGPDLGESYRGTAALADKVLKGVHPADLPVEEPTQFSLCINLKTAKALGLTIPPMFLARADQVIE